MYNVVVTSFECRVVDDFVGDKSIRLAEMSSQAPRGNPRLFLEGMQDFYFIIPCGNSPVRPRLGDLFSLLSQVQSIH